MGRYEFFEHTADVGMRIEADRFEELLETAAAGLAALQTATDADIPAEQTAEFAWNGDEPALVLFDWLDELIFRFEVDHFVTARTTVRCVGENAYQAQLWGATFDAERFPAGNEVKAVTYHGLRAEKVGDRWQAEVVFDI